MCLKTISLFLILGFISLAQGKRLSAWAGDDVELHCLPNHRPGTNDPLDWSGLVKWTAIVDGYPKRMILHNDGEVDKNNFTRPYEYDPDTHSILLEDASEEDSTKWECDLDNSNLYPGKVQLDVYSKPEIEVVQEAMHLEDSGELTKAVCTVNNMNRNFDYEVFWTGNLEEAIISDPETFENEDGSFTVRTSYSVDTNQDITKSDLTCNLKLKNWNGSAGVENFIENESMKLQIITTTTQAPTTPTPVAPQISKKHWDEVEVFEVGTSRDYKCKAKGSQDITYVWHKNGEKVSTGQTITIKVESMEEHGDVYKCIATNQIGTQYSQFQLDVQGEPRFDADEEHVYIEPSEDKKEIVCAVNSNPIADKFVWTMNGSEVELQHFEEESMKQSTATLMRSELNEEGVNEIMCTAENGKGKTTKTFKVHLKSSQVMSGGMIALVVLIVLFLFGATGAGVLVVKRRQQLGGDQDVEQNLCYRGLLCGKGGADEKEKEEGEEEKGEVGPAENDDVKEEGDEEKQKLTEKTTENGDTNEEKTEDAGEEEAMLEKGEGETPKKKKRFQGLRGPLGCCKKSRKQLQENEEEEDKVNEEGDPAPQEEEVKDEKEKGDESDRDSGKGDTLKPNMEAEVDK